MFKPGDVVLAKIQFTDSFEIKTRPAVVLYEEYGNIVVAGITSNLEMQGISLTTKDGMIKNSVIKLNYIFTVSKQMVSKLLFHLPKEKKIEVFNELTKRLALLKN